MIGFSLNFDERYSIQFENKVVNIHPIIQGSIYMFMRYPHESRGINMEGIIFCSLNTWQAITM